MNMYLELQMEYSSQRDQFQPDILTYLIPRFLGIISPWKEAI